MKNDQQLREHLLYLLGGGGAHIGFESVIKDFPSELINTKVDHVPYTAWQLLEHMRIAQWDILEFCRNPNHVSPHWPEGYWPDSNSTATGRDWKKSIARLRTDLKAIQALVTDPSSDLLARIKHGEGQTILREALLIADHNAYHLGVLVTLKRILLARIGGTAKRLRKS